MSIGSPSSLQNVDRSPRSGRLCQSGSAISPCTHRFSSTSQRSDFIAGSRTSRILSSVTVSQVEIHEPQELDVLGAVLGVEGLVSTRIRLERLRFVQRVKVRPLLCELHNLRHDLELVRLAPSSTPAAWLVVDRVAELRSTWWDLDRHQRVRRISELVDAAVEGVDDALAQYRRDVSNHGAETFSLGGYWRNVRSWSRTVARQRHRDARPTRPRRADRRGPARPRRGAAPRPPRRRQHARDRR